MNTCLFIDDIAFKLTGTLFIPKPGVYSGFVYWMNSSNLLQLKTPVDIVEDPK